MGIKSIFEGRVDLGGEGFKSSFDLLSRVVESNLVTSETLNPNPFMVS